MSIRVGNIISRNPFKTSVTFSDYGNVVYDNGATANRASDEKIASTFEFFKMIQESLLSLDIVSTITTYSNGSDSKHNCVCLNFIIDSQEYMLSVYWFTTAAMHIYACVRGNASDETTIRPKTPNSINVFYDVYQAVNADLAAYIGSPVTSVGNYAIWTHSGVSCNVQTVIYDDVLYLLAKCASAAPLCIMIGKLGKGVVAKDYGAIGFISPSISSVVRPAFATEEINGWWGMMLPNTPNINEASKLVAFPLTFTTQSESTSGIEWTSILPVDSKYMLVTSKYPTSLTTPGTKFGNGSWLSASITYDNKCILIPWDGSSTSVFD